MRLPSQVDLLADDRLRSSRRPWGKNGDVAQSQRRLGNRGKSVPRLEDQEAASSYLTCDGVLRIRTLSGEISKIIQISLILSDVPVSARKSALRALARWTGAQPPGPTCQPGSAS